MRFTCCLIYVNCLYLVLRDFNVNILNSLFCVVKFAPSPFQNIISFAFRYNVKHDLSWKSLLAMPPNLLSFCLNSTYDVLPSPSNLKRWRISSEACCNLCGKQICTTAHVLSACKTALTQGRYTFRHDSVLRELLAAITKFVRFCLVFVICV